LGNSCRSGASPCNLDLWLLVVVGVPLKFVLWVVLGECGWWAGDDAFDDGDETDEVYMVPGKKNFV
jgi:hypothetical protein